MQEGVGIVSQKWKCSVDVVYVFMPKNIHFAVNIFIRAKYVCAAVSH